MDAKQRLRAEMKQKMAGLPEGIRSNGCTQIIERLAGHTMWRQAQTVGITISTAEEIDTKALIEKAWDEQKGVAVPKSDAKTKAMDFRIIQSFEQLKAGYAGILEPVIERTERVLLEDIDLLVVPGLVFDHNGYRIGFGGGFYDRFLVEYPNQTVSIAFEMQMVEEIPRELFDRPVDAIVTEQRIIKTGG